MAAAELEGMLASVEQDTIPNEAFDWTSHEVISVDEGANDRRNSSTCSKQPRKIS